MFRTIMHEKGMRQYRLFRISGIPVCLIENLFKNRADAKRLWYTMIVRRWEACYDRI